VLAGCQYNTEIGAVNRCGEVVEADVAAQRDSVEDGPAGEVLEPGEQGYLRSVPESKDEIYVMVRRPDSERVMTRTVAISGLADMPDDSDYEKEVVLSGDLCPS
ncbi:MAG TPA: hypothetical protein VK059_00685, partial [Nocardioidaceae bacterium]|nr:hypothetical protein [Nocardioidaceae bacterium]